MKFNWGTGIALVYGVFVVGMVGAVLASTKHNPGLVQDDYYKLDLNYQEHFDKKQNAANLEGGLPIRFEADQNRIKIDFPERLGAPSGKVKLFRSATLSDDKFIDITPDEKGDFYIPTDGFYGGLWNIEVDWAAGGTAFFNEQRINL
jgi:nitrogen fixation protein FixH